MRCFDEGKAKVFSLFLMLTTITARGGRKEIFEKKQNTDFPFSSLLLFLRLPSAGRSLAEKEKEKEKNLAEQRRQC